MTDSQYHLNQLRQWADDGGRELDAPEDETQSDDLSEKSVIDVAPREVVGPS